jgi:hypothetical protein
LGRVVVAGTATIAAILAIALLLPLVVAAAVRGRTSGADGALAPISDRLAAVLHFASIGAGFMAVEMVMLQKMTRLLGDPVVSSAAVLTAILFFSGCGSALIGVVARDGRNPAVRIRVASLAVVLLGIAFLAVIDPLIARAAALPPAARFIVTVLLLAPVSLPLGLFFPAGMQILDGTDPAFVPVAWGINGFASVVASPLAVLLSMSYGFRAAMACGLALYALVGVISLRWRQPEPPGAVTASAPPRAVVPSSPEGGSA